MKKKIMVIGGAGFIGYNFVKHLLSLGYQVFNIDALSYSANKKQIKNINNANHKFYNLNINQKKILNILRKNQILDIVNFASETHVDNSIKNPGYFFKNNCEFFLIFLQNLKIFYNSLSKKNKKKFNFLYVSTDEVYGSLKKKEKSFTENSNYFPRNPYSASKASAEMILYSFSNTYKIPYIISNSSNNYGKYQNGEKLIPTIFKNALKHKKIPIYGNGKNIRDWLFVDDHCKALLLLLKKGNKYNKYNIGGDNEFTNLEIAKKICKILDQKLPRKKSYSNLIKYVNDRVGHDFRYSINCQKIKKLGWEKKVSIDSGLKDIADFYIKKYK